jgi:phenylacetate-CoA ligase
MMKVKGVIVFPSQIEAALMQFEDLSDNYQIIKRKKGDITSLSVEVEPSEKRWKEGKIDDLEKDIEEEIFSILNLHVPVKIVEPKTIPRSIGKAVRVVER